MADELKLRLLATTDTQRYERGTGRVFPITRVEYMLGEQGPFVFECPREEFSEAKLREAVNQKINALRPFIQGF